MQHGWPRFAKWLIGFFLFGLLNPSSSRTWAQSPNAYTRLNGGRLIATGWDSPTPQRFRNELEAFEALGLFDGTTIVPTRHLSDGRDIDSRNAFTSEHWTWAEFAPALNHLRQVHPTSSTENFLFLYANPGNVDWFDEAGWREVCDHWRLLARLAKQGGLKGLLFDAEPYTPPFSQFLFRAQPFQKNHTFSEYRMQARIRGRQVMQAISEEYPEMILMSYRLLSDVIHLVPGSGLPATLESQVFGLLPSFIDGWLDASTPSLILVEGNEEAYGYNKGESFDSAYRMLRLNSSALLAPEHRSKYWNQWLIGHGMYLDAYLTTPQSRWHIDSKGSTPSRKLAANLSAALAASEGYVWIYGEDGRWWPGANSKWVPWIEKFKGVEKAIQMARKPWWFAQHIIQSRHAADNRLADGDFAQRETARVMTSWAPWQSEYSHGSITEHEGLAILQHVEDGVIGQTIRVNAGELYAFSALVKNVGQGSPFLSIGWKSPEGRWITFRALTLSPSSKDQNGWQSLSGLITVPEGIGQLIFMLGVQNQHGASDQTFFKQARLYPVLD